MLPVAKYLLFHANEICRAERRWGELYRQSETAKASGSNQFKETSPPATSPPTLGSMGVTRTQSSNWQALADIPEDEFERRLRGKDPQNCVACSLILTQLSKHEHVWVAATVYRALNEGSEPMRVTFDTNALSDVIAPETSQRGALGAASGKKVRAAIEVDHMQGFFCETLITLEGIKNADRSAVFGSTAVDTTYRHGTAPDGNGVTYIDMRVGTAGPQTT